MVLAIGINFFISKRSIKNPLTNPVIDLTVGIQRTMGTIMCKNKQTQLPSANNHNGQNNRERVCPNTGHNPSAENYTPAMHNR